MSKHRLVVVMMFALGLGVFLLPASAQPIEWFAWAYLPEAGQLVLLDRSGVVSTQTVPTLPGEDPLSQKQVGFSRDGAIMAVSSQSGSGHPLIGFQNLNGGSLVTWQGNTGETAAFDFVQIPMTTFNPDSTRFAVALYNGEYVWRIVVLDTASATPLAQLDLSIPGVSAMLEAPLTTFYGGVPPFLFPRIVYYDGENVYFQLVVGATEGMPQYAAFAWSPSTNTVSAAPQYIHVDMEIDPVSGEMLYALDRPDVSFDPAFVTTDGPGSPSDTLVFGYTTPQTVWSSGQQIVYQPRLTADNAGVLFNGSSNTNPQFWTLIYTDAATILPSTVIDTAGAPQGFLSVEFDAAINTHYVSWHNLETPTIPERLWTAPPGQRPYIVWSQPRVMPYNGLRRTEGGSFPIRLTPTPAPTATLPGVVYCTGTPPSQIAVGIVARVTFTDGTQTRLRDNPGGEIILLMPEGMRLNVVGGPACGGRFTWWEVVTETGERGWVAEGDFETYYIEPVPR